MNRSTLFVGCCFLVGSLLVGCGEEEPPPPDPRTQCADENLKVRGDGSLDAEAGTSTIDVTAEADEETPGRITGQEIRIRLGEATPPGGSESHPVILRLHDPEGPEEFARALATMTRNNSATLEVIDASEVGPGSEDLTSLDDFDCAINFESAGEDCSGDSDCSDGYLCHEEESICAPDPEETQGTICAQIGFDKNDDNNLHSDNEEYVYNATGGEVEIEGFFSGPPARFAANWTLDLGPNILEHDDTSSGEFDGCIRPEYSTQPQYWPLK